jgi:hypothetical protein
MNANNRLYKRKHKEVVMVQIQLQALHVTLEKCLCLQS